MMVFKRIYSWSYTLQFVFLSYVRPIDKMNKTTKTKRKRQEESERKAEDDVSKTSKKKEKKVDSLSSQIQAEMDDMDALFGEVVCLFCWLMENMVFFFSLFDAIDIMLIIYASLIYMCMICRKKPNKKRIVKVMEKRMKAKKEKAINQRRRSNENRREKRQQKIQEKRMTILCKPITPQRLCLIRVTRSVVPKSPN